MLSKSLIIVSATIALAAVLVSSNSYGPSYNDGYEQQADYQPAQSYHQQAPQMSYHQPAAPAYHQAPAYKKYNAPSSAHHTQYDNYYPKQSYNKPMYAPAKQYAAPAPAYQAPKPAYPAPAYGGGNQYEEGY